MLATAGDLPLGRPGWAFEIKWDGFRGLVRVAGDQLRIDSRNNRPLAARYPELTDLPAAVGGRPMMLAGELVVLDAQQRPAFELLQHRLVPHPARPWSRTYRTERTAAGVWAEQVEEHGAPVTVTNETAFLVDFLPVIRRSVSRTGFQIDHVQYYCDALKPWIACWERLGKFVLRRDPRDISRIWALDPDGTTYLEVPYRTLSRPPISVWEQQAAVARLREQGRAEVDENTLFAMVERMGEITDTATGTARKARRDHQRRSAIPDSRPSAMPPDPPHVGQADVVARPFEVIEQW